MRILITGGGGFLGQRLATALAKNDAYHIVLTDVIEPKPVSSATTTLKADLTTADGRDHLFKLVGPTLDCAFLLHGIMSGGAEENFELGMVVNVDATRAILDILKQSYRGVRVVFTSSTAIYGGEMPEVVDETVMPNPQSSYGTEKTVCEYLLNDYSRRGYVDAVSIRFPTVIVRPGPPSSATSSFCSGIIREPLAGLDAALPVDPQLLMWFGGIRTIIDNTIYAGIGLDTSQFAKLNTSRTVNMPGVTVTVQQMLDTLADIKGPEILRFIKPEKNPVLERIVTSWPPKFNISKAIALGFSPDPGHRAAIEDYMRSVGQ